MRAMRSTRGGKSTRAARRNSSMRSRSASGGSGGTAACRAATRCRAEAIHATFVSAKASARARDTPHGTVRRTSPVGRTVSVIRRARHERTREISPTPSIHTFPIASFPFSIPLQQSDRNIAEAPPTLGSPGHDAVGHNPYPFVFTIERPHLLHAVRTQRRLRMRNSPLPASCP